MFNDKRMIIPMTHEYAARISQWKYDGIYSFYNHSEESLEELMDDTHYACIDSLSDLIGYYCFGKDARIPTIEENVYDDGFIDIGLGMRPDLCGKNSGLEFVSFGLDYARKKYKNTGLRLSVAAFNERAIKVYQKAGFTKERVVTNSYFMNKFLIMKYVV